MIYQHPLAYLIGIEGQALLRAWGGEFDEEFVRARLDEVTRLIHDETLRDHPGVSIEPDETDSAYRQWAPSYDDPANGLLELDLPFIDAALDTVPAGRALDTACGTGRLARRLAERGHDVTGVDRSAEMLDRARRSVPGVTFRRGDLGSLPADDGSFDLITNALALTHVADLHAVFREFARVLRPGGTAIITDVHPDLVFLGSTVKASGASGRPQLAATHRHSVGDHLHAALSVGFDVIRYTELPTREQRTSTYVEPGPAGRSGGELGTWRDWPWSLLDRVPGAAHAAWNIPSVMAWQLRRS